MARARSAASRPSAVLDADDILRGNETAALRSRIRYTSNGDGMLVSETGAVKVGNFDILGQINWRSIGNYEDGAGIEVLDSGRGQRVQPGQGPLAPGPRPPDHRHHHRLTTRSSSTGRLPRARRGATRTCTISSTSWATRLRGPTRRSSISAPRSIRTTPRCIRRSWPPGWSPSVPSAASMSRRKASTSATPRASTSAACKWALTYGGDAFHDTVSRSTMRRSATATSSHRAASAPWPARSCRASSTIFEHASISSLRCATTPTSSNGGAHVPPMAAACRRRSRSAITLFKGVTVFGTYAEGYRAPAITETLIHGHASASRRRSCCCPIPTCGRRSPTIWEGGVNLKFDNVLQKGDAFRGRVVAFQNKVDDYIDIVQLPMPAPFGSAQYQNIANATIEGVEVEAMYDAQSLVHRAWAAIASAAPTRTPGSGLLSIPADQVTLTAGFRALEQQARRRSAHALRRRAGPLAAASARSAAGDFADRRLHGGGSVRPIRHQRHGRR